MNKKAVDYIKALSTFERRAICRKCGISESWILNMIYTGRNCSPETAIKLEQATKGGVRREDLRPDIKWDLIEQ